MDMATVPLQVMDLVELRSLQHALVGRPGESGLSVEARKRLTIAVEMVSLTPSARYCPGGVCSKWPHSLLPLVLTALLLVR